MTTWFTSDLHIGHERIIEFCNRPFSSVEEMNGVLRDNWNGLVADDDEVYVLGDLALGKLDDSLAVAAELTGRKFLVPGNHDRVWSGYRRGGVRQRDIDRYSDAGFMILPEQFRFQRCSQDMTLLMCHFPYVGDSREVDRHADKRPEDLGLWLLHGHTHQNTAINALHPRQVHVGVDSWNFEPVSLETVQDIIATSEWIDGVLDAG